MEELNRNIDHLFAKAKTAEAGMSIEQVKLGIAVSTVAGATAATGLITKLKLVSIMIASGLAVTATVVLLSSNNNEVSETVLPLIENEKIVQVEPKTRIEIPTQKTLVAFEEERDVEFIETVDFATTNKPKVNLDIPDLTTTITAPLDKKEVGDFHSIVVQINCDVELFKGDKCETDVLQSELSDVIDFTITHGVLVIGVKEGREKDYRKVAKNKIVEVELTMKNLKAIQVQGAAVIHSDDNIPSDDLSVSIQGSGDVVLHKVAPESYSIALAGSGDVSIKGKGDASKGDVQITGSGDVCIPNIKAEDVEVHISGSGDVNVNVTSNLDVQIAGSGDVSYTGDPKVHESITGSGDVRKGCSK